MEEDQGSDDEETKRKRRKKQWDEEEKERNEANEADYLRLWSIIWPKVQTFIFYLYVY